MPADYSDVLLENWTKPSYNPIIENTQRDPSTPWKSPSGEWRLRTYDAKVYGAASDADMLAGKWYVPPTEGHCSHPMNPLHGSTYVGDHPTHLTAVWINMCVYNTLTY